MDLFLISYSLYYYHAHLPFPSLLDAVLSVAPLHDLIMLLLTYPLSLATGGMLLIVVQK